MRAGGRSRASDTPRSMSGLWSQCPWGKPRPYERFVVAVYHSSGVGGYCYRVAGRLAPVTARKVRADAGTSALGVGGGPYGGVVAACHSTGGREDEAEQWDGIGRSRAPPLRIESVPVRNQRAVYHIRHRVRRAGSSRPTKTCGHRPLIPPSVRTGVPSPRGEGGAVPLSGRRRGRLLSGGGGPPRLHGRRRRCPRSFSDPDRRPPAPGSR